MTFDEVGLSEELLKAVTAAGYSEPTPIQAQAIPSVLSMRDVTGIAQTGTGKTAAFVLPMIDRLAQGRSKARMPRSLVIAPTRELAAQVAENFEKYGVNHKLTMALLIGGVSFGDQDKLLMQGVDVLIATPGRLIDQFERGKLLLTGVEMLVIDEADRMLDMGFIPDIEKICKLLPPRRQTLLFSATMPPEIARLAAQFQTDPKRIEVSRPAQTADTITQYKIPLKSSDHKARRTAIRRVIESRDVTNGIVFCNRKSEVDIVAKSLTKHGHDAAPIHGDLPQAYRTQTLDKFRNGELKLLVASDVAARGLDIPAVGHVFNYSPPPNSDDYVHRIGRTGRAGRTGESFTLVCPEDEKLWDAVVKRVEKSVEDYMPEGLAEELEALPSDGGRSSRSRGRRNDRNDRSDRSERPARSERSERSEKSASRESSKDKEKKQSRGNKSRGDSELLPPAPAGPVVGLGDHVPAFLQRPI
ncbi:DEAD/DEAH box helicase [Ponticaulis sp.]|uniref:DEAD/DEAH box helicase n=1 Tax=Ponticaulis sp. TaxID=2020902 RepID=UPI000C3E6294|nr:DEAD/DEAH box helicase [Ponticaulis sp.]MAJ08380.1 RNA helicase [Ponticaulis sp.]|tara:strand:- start:9255 stop:10670 length:1416 start_codon:yes stop_codon:yes gene_type:complete